MGSGDVTVVPGPRCPGTVAARCHEATNENATTKDAKVFSVCSKVARVSPKLSLGATPLLCVLCVSCVLCVLQKFICMPTLKIRASRMAVGFCHVAPNVVTSARMAGALNRL